MTKLSQAVCGLVVLLHLNTFYSVAQNTGGNSSGTGISIIIEPIKKPIRVGDNLSIKATIVNNTNEFLVLHFVPSLSAMNILIHDAKGNTPQETDEGCKRHRSQSCSTGRQNGGSGSSQTGYVLPGKAASTDVDVSLEYSVNYPSTFAIEVAVDDFVAVNAPIGTDVFSLGGYPHRKVGLVHSNTIKVQVIP
jgi:hypothetical protein